MTVPETTSETLKHKINPSVDLAEPQTVHVLLYTPGTVVYCLFLISATFYHSCQMSFSQCELYFTVQHMKRGYCVFLIRLCVFWESRSHTRALSDTAIIMCFPFSLIFILYV